MLNRRMKWIALPFLLVLMLVFAVSFAAAQDSAAPYLGIGLSSVENGVRVEEVASGSPAAAAGLRVGDVITAVDGAAVTADDIAATIAGFKVGDSVALTIERGSESLDLMATLAERPQTAPSRPPMQQRGERPALGVNLENTDDGVVIRAVATGSAAEAAGLQVGDVLTRIADTPITTAAEAAAAIRDLKVGDTVAVEVQRAGETLTVDAVLTARTPQMSVAPFPGNGFGITYNDSDKSWQLNSISEDSPLYAAGLRSGDVITLFDGTAYDAVGLRDYLNKLTADEVVLTILRAGETQELTVPAAALDALNIFGLNFGDQSFQIPFGSMMGMSGVRLGVEFLVLDDQVAAENNVSQTEGALLTTIIDGSPAATAGLKVNDIITAVDGDKVDQERTLRDRLLAYEPGDTVTLSVLRGDETLDVEVTLEQVAMSDLMPFFEGSGFNFQFPQPPQPAQPLLEGAAL